MSNSTTTATCPKGITTTTTTAATKGKRRDTFSDFVAAKLSVNPSKMTANMVIDRQGQPTAGVFAKPNGDIIVRIDGRYVTISAEGGDIDIKVKGTKGRPVTDVRCFLAD